MSSHKSAENIESAKLSVVAEKAPNFAELQAEKERLFKEIEEKSGQLSMDEKGVISVLVLNHSIKDGFELARKIGLSPRWFGHALTRGMVVSKHNYFAEKFSAFVERNEPYIDRAEVAKIGNSSLLTLPTDLRAEPSQNEHEFYLGKAGAVGNDIDAYYINFIRNRRLKSPEAPTDSRTQVEVTAEDHLLSAEAVLEESYYTGPIRELFVSEVQKYRARTGQDRADNITWPDIVPTLKSNLVTRKDLEESLDTLRNNLGTNKGDFEEQLKKTLHSARYAPSRELFDQRKREAIKGLLEGRKQEGVFEGKPYTKLIPGITQSLIARGFKPDEFEVKFDEVLGEYVVIEKEKEEGLSFVALAKEGKVEKGKENFKQVEEVPNEVEYKNEPYFLDGVDILDGGVYKTYHSKTSESIIIDQRGASEFSGKLFKLHKSGSHEVLISHSKEIDGSVYTVDGRELRCENFQAYGNETVELNGRIYWCGYESLHTIPRSGNHAVMIDDEVLIKYGTSRTFDGDLKVIAGRLTYMTENVSEILGHPRDVMLSFGSETFGPYDEIKLCENSKDKLIFYAKKGNEHFVYVDGVEKKMTNDPEPLLADGLEGQDIKIEEIVYADNDVFVCYQPIENNAQRKKYIYGVKDGTWEYRSRNIRNFSEVQGRLLYIDKQENWFVGWGKTEFSIDDIKSDTNIVVGLNDRLFISDKNRVLTANYSNEKYSTMKELTFDGTVEVINSGGKLFIIESLPDMKRIWEWSEKLELTDREMRDLNLANAVAKEDLDSIGQYFSQYYPDESTESNDNSIRAGIRSALERSRRFVGAVNKTIKEAPEMFLDTLRAKDDKPTEFLMTQMFYYMFPEAQAKRERALEEEKRNRKNPWNIFGGGGSGEGGGGREAKRETIDYDPGMNHLASVDEAGYYEMIRVNREVLKLREPLPPSTFITQGLFGNYTGSGWTKVNVPISQEVTDPAKETTFEFVDEKASQKVNLPKVANGKIVTERLKGIDSKGKEIPISIIEQNNLGEVRVDKGKDAKHIAYSISYSEVPKTMAEIPERDYEKFRTDFEKSFGDVMTKEIGDIGDELDIFVVNLKDKTPREKVIAIQEFCYEYGYYNLDNQPHDTDSFDERLAIMEGRMDELKAKDPELVHKKYAGICTDFATLTTALLRKAGFVSGIASGFVPEAGSTVVKTDRAHATSYVLWPNPENKEGKPDLIIVDGTPSSITPRIVEQEKKATEIRGGLAVDAEKELAKLEHILKTMDVEAIRNLQNGKLEQTLNHILYGVKQSHVDVMGRVLNASRYAGFDILEMTRGSIDEQIEFRKFLEEEIYNEKAVAHDDRERRGEELFNLMQEFTRRFEKDKNVKGKDEALDVLEKIFDTAESKLDPIEARSAAAIVTYLRARKMK